MTDLLDELRDANPVDPGSLQIPAELRSRVLARRGTRRRRALRPAGLAVGAMCAAIAVLLLASRGDDPDLSARAYAATTGPGIIHWRTEIVGSSGGKVGSRQRTEGWARNGVTHELRFDVIHGKAILQSDSRTAGGHTTTWRRAAHDYARFPTTRHQTTNPFRSGDPFAIFRRAYRTGKLTRVGPSRFGIDLPGSSDDAHRRAPLTYYDIDPDTALPIRLVVKNPGGGVVLGRPNARRPPSQTVMTFAVYEKLPFRETTRSTLRLLPHPAGGPRHIAAAEHYAALRTGAKPDPHAATAIATLARRLLTGQLEQGAARTLAAGTYLLPGPARLCLVRVTARGAGGGCKTTEEAIRRGLSLLEPGRGLFLVVPDGVTAVRARLRGHRYRLVAVHGNFAPLPAAAYAWRLIR
ncbi:MAG: hypothetical protein QOJ35_3280 [Solirubrobacteraceae bacterium]|nr:hypothetical protein [Solirubrobacteraceae bacterium]